MRKQDEGCEDDAKQVERVISLSLKSGNQGTLQETMSRIIPVRVLLAMPLARYQLPLQVT